MDDRLITAKLRRLRRGIVRSLLGPAIVALTPRTTLADPSSVDVDERYAEITASLEQGASRARVWWYGWTLGFAGLTTGELSVALATHDDGTRVDAVVGAIGSSIGVGAMLFLTSRSAFDHESRLAVVVARTPEEKLARLKLAEKILDDAAEDEAVGHSVFAHIGADVITLAGTFVLWAGYHRYASGWINLIGGTVVAEAQILTRPSAAIEARRAYRAGRQDHPPPRPLSWSLCPTFGGAAATLNF